MGTKNILVINDFEVHSFVSENFWIKIFGLELWQNMCPGNLVHKKVGFINGVTPSF